MPDKNSFKHISVLLNETIESLNIQEDGIYVDGTMGGAGHGCEICRRLGAKGRYIGIDQDEAAIAAGTARLTEFADRIEIIRSNYCNMKELLFERGIKGVDGILLDLGVSSYQLDTAERGFSYMKDSPLDMRMDSRNVISAKEVVNGYSEAELFRIIKEYGEEQFAKNIAKHIVKARENHEIETTGELVDIIKAAIPMKIQKQQGHPAKKVFQAIRIEVNQELEVLYKTLDDMIGLLNSGGRLSIITFHSLEDRAVKNRFRLAENPCTCPPSFPVCCCGKESLGRVVTRKPIIPSEEEMEFNSRAKSAKLRVFEKK